MTGEIGTFSSIYQPFLKCFDKEKCAEFLQPICLDVFSKIVAFKWHEVDKVKKVTLDYECLILLFS